MIDGLHRIAQFLLPAKIPVAVVGTVCFALFVGLLFIQGYDKYLVPCLVGVTWAIIVLAFIEGFKDIPAPVDDTMGFFARLKRRYRRVLFYCLGVASIVATLALVATSFRLIKLWL